MARQPIQAEYTTAIKGLITEASPFTYPENASLEEVNFILNKDGSRGRRFGIDYEIENTLIDIGVDLSSSNIAVSSHTWTAVANNGDLEFVVIQVGNKLYFFRSNQGSISSTPVNGGTSITITGNQNDLISGASIYGYFIIVHGTQEVTILSYSPSTDTITKTTKRLKIRDLFGVDDGLPVNKRPTNIDNYHRYNLYNQGWGVTQTTLDLEGASGKNAVDATKDRIYIYPSNADIMWTAKAASAKEVFAVGAYYPPLLATVSFGTTQAPLGKYIIDLFNRGTSRQTESGLILSGKSDTSSGGIVAVAAYAGRVFYAVRETSRIQSDSRSPNIGTMIFYSRADSSIDSLVQCYTEADPSSEHVFDPIATDGGFVTISEAGQTLKLITMGQSLFVFCSNGVWEIHGGEDQFSALNQNISKTTDIAVASPRSIVYAEDKIAFWGLSGIYMISRNDLTLRGGNNDLTYNTIQTLYDEIDPQSKQEVVGTYDAFLRTFRWLYRNTALPNDSFFNKELVYDTVLSAFYLFEINVPDYNYPFIIDYASSNSILSVLDDFDVLVGSDEVMTITDNVVIKDKTSSSTHKGSLKYLTAVKIGATHKITFSHFRNSSFRDWYSYNGVGIDAEARMLTGYTTGGTAMLEKSIEYLHVYMKRTELGLNEFGNFIDPSSCSMQVQWEWTNSISSGRWGRETEVYRLPRIYAFNDLPSDFDYGYTTVITKNKIRGKGRAMSILFKTKPDHNCVLYGWGISGSAGAV